MPRRRLAFSTPLPIDRYRTRRILAARIRRDFLRFTRTCSEQTEHTGNVLGKRSSSANRLTRKSGDYHYERLSSLSRRPCPRVISHCACPAVFSATDTSFPRPCPVGREPRRERKRKREKPTDFLDTGILGTLWLFKRSSYGGTRRASSPGRTHAEGDSARASLLRASEKIARSQ